MLTVCHLTDVFQLRGGQLSLVQIGGDVSSIALSGRPWLRDIVGMEPHIRNFDYMASEKLEMYHRLIMNYKLYCLPVLCYCNVK